MDQKSMKNQSKIGQNRGLEASWGILGHLVASLGVLRTPRTAKRRPKTRLGASWLFLNRIRHVQEAPQSRLTIKTNPSDPKRHLTALYDVPSLYQLKQLLGCCAGIIIQYMTPDPRPLGCLGCHEAQGFNEAQGSNQALGSLEAKEASGSYRWGTHGIPLGISWYPPRVPMGNIDGCDLCMLSTDNIHGYYRLIMSIQSMDILDG